MTIIQVMGKLVRNTAITPAEEKFKRIKLSNSKVKSAIVDSTGGVSSLLAMGWVYDEADKEHLILPKGKNMTMKEVSLTSICAGYLASCQVWLITNVATMQACYLRKHFSLTCPVMHRTWLTSSITLGLHCTGASYRRHQRPIEKAGPVSV